jgi:hypothetical protein
MEVALVFENTSGDVLRYLFHSNDLPFAYIDFILTRNGEVQKPIRHRGRGELSKEWVRELRPGGELMLHLRLQDVYGNLEPGLYALDVRVEGQPRDFGLTQFTLDQRVAYLQIDEVRDEQHRRKP